MGDTPHDRATRTFDRDALEQLARESLDAPEGYEGDEGYEGYEGAAPEDAAPVLSRTATVSDPLTMASLVADELLDHEAEPLPHPHLKRR
jgi:hypothetical protein